MAFFTSAINILQTLVVAIGAGLAVWALVLVSGVSSTCWKVTATTTVRHVRK